MTGLVQRESIARDYGRKRMNQAAVLWIVNRECEDTVCPFE